MKEKEKEKGREKERKRKRESEREREKGEKSKTQNCFILQYKKICLFLVTKNNLIKEKEQLELYIENLKKEISELEIQTKNLISNIELKNETKNLISNTNLLIELLKTQKTTFEIQDQKRPKRRRSKNPLRSLPVTTREI